MSLSVYFTSKRLEVGFIWYSVYTGLCCLVKQHKCVGENYVNRSDISWDVSEQMASVL